MDAIIFAMKALSMPMLAANAPVKFNLESTKKKTTTTRSTQIPSNCLVRVNFDP